MNPKPPSRVLLELTTKAVSGDATAEELSRLRQLLEADPLARSHYVEIVRLQSDLSWWALGDLDDAVDPERAVGETALRQATSKHGTVSSVQSGSVSTSEVRYLSAPRFALGMLAATILLVLGAGLGFWTAESRRGVAQLPQSGAHDQPIRANALTSGAGASVGEWSASTSCAWLGADGVTDALNREIRNGEELALLQGMAKVSLAGGLTMQIDGPAALVVASESSVVLQYGSLVGEAPDSEVVELAIPSGRLQIAGGRFGVKVAGERTEVHSFTGDVVAALNPFGKIEGDTEFPVDMAPEDLIVRPGEAVTLIASKGALRLSQRTRADLDSFATTRPMNSPLLVPERYVQRVLESKPLAYWRFREPISKSIPNELGSRYPLRLEGQVSFISREGNTFVDFGNGEDSGYLKSSDELTEFSGLMSYSIECWVKPSHYHQGLVVGLLDSPEVDPHGGVVLELQPGFYDSHPTSSRLRFLHRSPPSGSMRIGHSCYSDHRYHLRTWQHAVAVKDGVEMRLYLDGKLAGSTRDKTALVGSLHVMCGRLRNQGDKRAYVGQLDELAVYTRPLNAREIIQHCDAAPQGRQRVRVALQRRAI